MATVYSEWVGGDDWQVRLDYNVVNISNTQCRVDCTAYVVSQYGSMSNSTHCIIYCDGQDSVEVTNASFGTWTTKALQSWSFTVARPNGTAGRTISVSARIWALYGPSSYASGATASGSATIPARQYLQPNPPKSFAASRVSDAQMKLTWQGDYTGMDGDKPWSGIYVDRRTDDGDWQNIANLSWNAVNYTDNSTGANHKYEYRVCAYGPGGNSDHVEAAALYTTPAAPASVAVSRVSGTSVRVSADVSTAPYAESFEVQSNLNSGGWEAVDTVEMFPITDDAGGGTAVYRVRSVIGSLRSAWTESDPVTTIVPPLAPSVTVAGGASVVPTGTDLVVTWVPNHPDGSAQESAKVVLMAGASVVGTYTVEGSATSYDLGTVSSAGSYRVRVQTKGADPDWGAWSGWVSVTVAVPPSVHFSVPPVDGAAVGALPLTVEWDVADSTGVASQSIALLDASGRTLYSAEPGPSVRELVLGDSTYRLSNATEYSLRITVRGGSSLTATAERSFRTSFAEPARPTAQAATDPSDMSVAVSVQAGAASSASGEVIEVPATPGTLVPGFEVYGRTRQNLWVNPSGTSNGVTVTSNDDGTFTASGTGTADNSIQAGTFFSAKPSTAYTVECDKAVEGGRGFFIRERRSDKSQIIVRWFGGTMNPSTKMTFTTDNEFVSFDTAIGYSNGVTISGTYRVMLREATEDEIAAAQQTASTLQDGGTADLPQDYPVTLPTDPSVYADAEAFDWCPPGINGVEPSAIVTAGKNLWKNPEFTDEGITASANPDGGLTLTGTSTASSFANKMVSIPTLNGGEYTLSVIGSSDAYLFVRARVDGVATTIVSANSGTRTFTVADGCTDFLCGIQVAEGKTVDSTIYVQLERGPIATEYEQPSNSAETPIDMQGQALYEIGDARDVLHVDGTGAASIERYIGDIASYGGESIGDTWLASELGADGNPATGAHVIYLLDETQTVELDGTVVMPEFPADPTTMWAVSDIPGEVAVAYPDTDSLSVTRVLDDGSRWTVADGLLSGQQAIDPLPPLNVPYRYEVTASTEAGSAYTLDVPHEVGTVMAAFNFGAAAGTAELARLDPSWSHSRQRSATLYHFADGGESGGLPVAYGSPDVDGSLSQGFTLLDMDQLRRMQAEARMYPVCWFRDPYGGRYLVYATWDFSASIPWDRVEVTASMTETVFEEAW